MITIEEFLNKKHIVGMTELIAPIMIEFAQMHVMEALKEASEKSKFKVQSYFETIEEINNSIEDCTGCLVVIDKNSILNAYPLDKIK
jgi:hypothetical protein